MKIRKTYFNQRKEHLISYMSSKDMDFPVGEAIEIQIACSLHVNYINVL